MKTAAWFVGAAVVAALGLTFWYTILPALVVALVLVIMGCVSLIKTLSRRATQAEPDV